MYKKIRVAVLFGGKSAEHEVSLKSAKNIVTAIDKNKYEIILIGIDKHGHWLSNSNSKLLLNKTNHQLTNLNNDNPTDFLAEQKSNEIVNILDYKNLGPIDVIFPILHGPYGEDGTVQGLLKLLNIPFVGPGILGSAVGMDKDVMKRLLKEANIPVAKFIVINNNSLETTSFNKIARQLGSPFFIKPANLGSSVGVSKVKNEAEFKKAIKNAFYYDNKILIEEYIKGREIECSILGNETPIASVPGEIIVKKEFYSYDAKYIDKNGASLKIPAHLPENIIKKIQILAVKTFKTLCAEGMARVDFFLSNDGKIFVNEINTIPGFTKISMYPKLWEASGISYSELIDLLIYFAIERHKKNQKLKTSIQ